MSVALTGNVASGKSTVLKFFRDWGAFTTDADEIVRDLQQPGMPVFRAMVERFGPSILTSDGALDRPVLRRLVFSDEGARADLEAIVHPAVRARRVALEAAARDSGAAVAVHDIPLLFEAADPAEFDRVVLVDAPEARRKDWLMRLRGLSEAEARSLLAAQMAPGLKRPRSDVVIENDADLETLERRARAVWDRLTAEAARRA